MGGGCDLLPATKLLEFSSLGFKFLQGLVSISASEKGEKSDCINFWDRV